MIQYQYTDGKIGDVVRFGIKNIKLENMIRRLLELLKLVKPHQQHLPQKNVSGQGCGCCKKQLTAGAFPKWFCLRNDCEMYLKAQTLR